MRKRPKTTSGAEGVVTTFIGLTVYVVFIGLLIYYFLHHPFYVSHDSVDWVTPLANFMIEFLLVGFAVITGAISVFFLALSGSKGDTDKV